MRGLGLVILLESHDIGRSTRMKCVSVRTFIGKLLATFLTLLALSEQGGSLNHSLFNALPNKSAGNHNRIVCR